MIAAGVGIVLNLMVAVAFSIVERKAEPDSIFLVSLREHSLAAVPPFTVDASVTTFWLALRFFED